MNSPCDTIVRTAGVRNCGKDFSFDAYKSDLASNDVFIELPEGFKPFDVSNQKLCSYFRNISYSHNTVYWNPIGLISDNDEAVFLYPYLLLNCNGMQYLGYLIERDLRTQYLDHNLDVSPYVKVISQSDMSDYSNVEKAATYELDLSFLPFNGKYTKCIGVYLKKRKHPAMLIRILLTEDSYKDKEKYVRKIFDSIRYGDGNAYENRHGDESWDHWWREDDPSFPWVRNNFSDKEQKYYRNQWKQKIKKIKKCWDEGKEYEPDPIILMP